jgi:hypothetical protein
VDYLKWFLPRFGVKILDIVRYISQSPPCLICGRHQLCRIGGLYRARGEAALTLVVEPDHFRRWEDDSMTMEAVAAAAEKLRELETTR